MLLKISHVHCHDLNDNTFINLLLFIHWKGYIIWLTELHCFKASITVLMSYIGYGKTLWTLLQMFSKNAPVSQTVKIMQRKKRERKGRGQEWKGNLKRRKNERMQFCDFWLRIIWDDFGRISVRKQQFCCRVKEGTGHITLSSCTHTHVHTHSFTVKPWHCGAWCDPLFSLWGPDQSDTALGNLSPLTALPPRFSSFTSKPATAAEQTDRWTGVQTDIT